ncbi:MAG: (4Fe-4S)-binding protein [Gemmatimonadaceae bacterium]
MPKRLQLYGTDAIEVTFDPNRCIHSANCIRQLPEVFDSRARPWIRPAAADAARIADVVSHCPTGALHARRLDGALAEQPAVPATITPVRNGPLYVRGEVQVELEDGATVTRDLRIALCRCGKSGSQPFCDGTHREIGFVAP